MRFTEIKGEIPRSIGKGVHNIRSQIEEFMAMNVKVAKVTWTSIEYKDYKSCYQALHKAVDRGGYPVQVLTRNEEVYIIRKDI